MFSQNTFFGVSASNKYLAVQPATAFNQSQIKAQIQAQIISASISMQGQVIISQQGNVDVMDLGGF